MGVAVSPRLAGWDEVQADVISDPVRHFGTSQFGAVVPAQDTGVAALGGQAIEFGNEVLASQVAFDRAAEAVANFRATCSGYASSSSS